ncbi:MULTISPECIES: tetratricopeptide repeat-containing sensor histidine kinase [Niastella]|uniref:histidine kinase n=1 Tax=Niastella soli TaxID=2821487 RepID=A0ABS3YRG0_9BACT|nr:histidine kinase dimerization/phosphoacceptor domain -containing protein [Niastella soli]MBO9200482.1 ATP-binding protein [Niastella soli]
MTRALTQYAQSETQQELLVKLIKSKPDTNRISIELKLGAYYLYKPFSEMRNLTDYKHNPDSAIDHFNKALQLSVKLNESDWQHDALEWIAYYYQRVNDPVRTMQLFNQVITYFREKGKHSKEAHAWKSLANAYFINDKFNKSATERINHYQHARSLYLQSRQPIDAAHILTDIAANRITIKQFELAEKELQQSLAEYKAAKYEKLQYTYMTLVDLEYSKGNYYRALAYCLEGIKNSVPGEDSHYISYFYWNAARCNFGVKKYQKAEEWLLKAISINDYPDYKYLLVETLLKLNRNEEALKTINAITKANFPHTSWDTANIYRCMALYHAKSNSNELSIRYYLKSLKMTEKLFGERSYSWHIICYNGIAEAFLNANQPAKAKKYITNAALIFKKAETISDNSFLVDFYNNSYKYDITIGKYRAAFKNAKTPLGGGLLMSFYTNSYNYYVAIGNYQDASYNLARLVKLQDSLSTVDKNNEISELEIQYQTVKQEQSIKSLNDQNLIQKMRLEDANLQRNVTFLGIVIMLLVAGVLYRQNLVRKKNNQTITLQNDLIIHKNEQMQKLLAEKEWLLKEVHHRVKNNLHSVISLLEAQAAYLENDALRAIENSQHRIYAMSLIHQKLYQSNDIKTIDLKSYIPELVQYLRSSFETGHIRFNLEVDPLQLNASQAIPLGLIINEALTNSIKYAFPDGRHGEILISLTHVDGKYKLELADNGIGMQKNTSEVKKSSLGLELIRGLTKEIGGYITFENHKGVLITIVFERDILHSMNEGRDDYLTSL